MVSIICLTYNHVKYVSHAIEGFLMQKTNFTFEILIHDDASTDGTDQIIKEYALKYPDLFFPIYQSENQYSKGIRTIIATFVLPKCRGKYIALCEGDDYWIDPLKLQKQVDFMESNLDYGLVYSKVKVYIEKEKRFKKHCFGKSISSVEDLLIGNQIPTPTVLFRQEMYFSYLEAIQPDQKHWLMGDYPLWLWISINSKIKFFDSIFSVYRVLESSAVHSLDFKKAILLVDSYHSIKLFYIRKLGYSHLEKKSWEFCFLGKANAYIFMNEQYISDLVRDINDSNIRSLKISIIKYFISYGFLRKILKLYWFRKANS